MKNSLAITALAALAVTACGTAAAHPAPATRPAASQAAIPRPANPVTIVRETGATPDPGERYGHLGLENDQVGHGMFPGGEEIWVFTYDTAAHRAYWIAHPAEAPQDGETFILGPGISLVTVDAATLTTRGGPSPARIAARIRGTVLKP